MVTDPYTAVTGNQTLTPAATGVTNVIRYAGEGWVPQDIRRRRRQVMDAMRRFGTPVLVKHMYNDEDVDQKIATTSPNFSTAYGQTRHDDPISHGVGYVSVQTSSNEWVSPEGELVVSATNPGTGYSPAPYYRGYGPGYLTYVIEPDVPVDEFKLTETGVLVRTQTATGQAPWYPDMRDNDLLINVIIDRMENIIGTEERYQLKQVAPVSMRGLDRRGSRESPYGIGGNRFIVNHQFQMALVPPTDPIYQVEVDR